LLIGAGQFKEGNIMRNWHREPENNNRGKERVSNYGNT